MDVAMITRQLRILGRQGEGAAIRQLLDSPDIRRIAQASIAATLDDPEAVCRWAAKIPERDPLTISLYETELDREFVGSLARLEINTIGDADRLSDGELLACSEVNAFRLEELRAIVGKYLGKPKSIYMESSRREKVEKRVLAALARGDHPLTIAEELRLDATFVREIAAGALTEPPGKSRGRRSGQGSGVRGQGSGG